MTPLVVAQFTLDVGGDLLVPGGFGIALTTTLIPGGKWVLTPTETLQIPNVNGLFLAIAPDLLGVTVRVFPDVPGAVTLGIVAADLVTITPGAYAILGTIFRFPPTL